MIVYVLGEKFEEQHMFDVEAVCGEDFCDMCGDCLACYDGDPCPDLPFHRRVVYADQAAEWTAAHPGAENVDHLIIRVPDAKEGS